MTSRNNNLADWARFQAGAGGSGSQSSDTVTFHGATGDGVSDDTAAFGAAAKTIAASMNMLKTNFSSDGTPSGYSAAGIDNIHDIADTVTVRIPAGTYKLTSLVDTSGRNVIWIMETGAVVPNFQYLNGRVVHEGNRINCKTWGTGDNATGLSVLANVPLEMMAPTLGFPTAQWAAKYDDRDAVALQGHIQAPPILAQLSSCTFTSTTATSATAIETKLLKKGMLIDAGSSPKYTGWLKSWSEDGKTITVDAWWNCTTEVAGTPPNGSHCIINPNTKVFASNFNVVMHSSSQAQAASGCEVGIFNWQASKAIDGSPWGSNSYIWGYDASCANYRGNIAYLARDNWWYGFVAKELPLGFVATGSSSADYTAQDTSGNAYFSVKPASSGYIELGKPGIAGEPYIGFRSSIYSSNSVWDTMLYSSGGNGTIGGGDMKVGAISFVATKVRPHSDNGGECGTSAYRWSQIWAVNGSIQTSDAREKREITPLDTSLCEKLVSAIDAVSFVRSDEESTAAETRAVQRQKTNTVLIDKEVLSFEVVDGKAIRKVSVESVEVQEPVFEEYPVVDESGKPVYVKSGGVTVPMMHRVPVMEDVVETIAGTGRDGKISMRRHYGVIAQQVEQALSDLGVDTKDFAALIHDVDTDRYGIRYEELLMVLWPVVRGLVDRVSILEKG